VQLYRYFVSQSSEFCHHNPLCCFSTSVCCLFRYRLSPETFGYTLVCPWKQWREISVARFENEVLRIAFGTSQLNPLEVPYILNFFLIPIWSKKGNFVSFFLSRFEHLTILCKNYQTFYYIWKLVRSSWHFKNEEFSLDALEVRREIFISYPRDMDSWPFSLK
jgi:hypothetical protein